MRRALLGIVILAFLSVAASCPQKRHDTTNMLDGLTQAMRTLQTQEINVRQSRPCETVTAPCISASDHQKFGTAMVKAWNLDELAIKAVQAWKPGQPIPANVRDLVVQLQSSVLSTLSAFGTPLNETVATVYQEIVNLLLAFSGGAA